MILFVFRKLLVILLAFMIIIDTNSIYRQYIDGAYFYSVVAFILISLIIIEKITIQKILQSLFYAGIICVLYFYQYINMPINGEFQQKLYLVLFFFLFPLFISYFIFVKNKYTIFYTFSTLMSVLALYSSILWFLCSFIQVIPLPHIALNNWADFAFVPSFYYIYFETQKHVFFGLELVRNSAIFAEGPMFSICLLSALVIELLLRTNRNKYKIASLIIGIITSTSFTAYILSSLIFIFFYISFKVKKINIVSIVIGLVLLLCFALTVSVFLNEKQDSNAVSYDARSYGYISGIRVFSENPLFGKGFYSQTESNSNSIFVILPEIGISGSLLFIYGLLIMPIILCFQRKHRNVGLAWLLFFFAYCTTIVTYCLISFFFTSFMIANSFNYINKKKDEMLNYKKGNKDENNCDYCNL